MNKIAPLLLIPMLLTACSGGKNNTGEKIGQAAGAVIGGVVGSEVGSGKAGAIAVGLGAILGAILGKELGRTIDEMDRDIAQKAAHETLETAETGESASWSNPDSGNSGSTTPVSTVQSGECRDFKTSVIIDSEEQQTTGRACKQDDGTWKIVSGVGTPISTP